jgi:hypothetical protein
LIKESILALLARFQRIFPIYHKSLVHIEGGLGSQILGVISFWERQSQYGVGKAACDLSYFRLPKRENLWNWELVRYRISLDELRAFESAGVKNLLKIKTDFLSTSEINADYWVHARAKYLDRFEIDRELLTKMKSDVESLGKLVSYGAVHIRRGDYLQVASKVIRFNEYLELLVSIQNLIPNDLLIISDSKLEDQEKVLFVEHLGQGRNLVFLDDPQSDPFLIHCLLREANVLVTSNSTFSFSAALLGKSGQLAFSPVNFHTGKSAEKYNRSFRSAGSFMTLKLEE